MKLLVLLPIVAVMALLAWRRVGLLTWVVAWWLAVYAALRFAFATPIPASVISMYMGIATLALLAYVASSRERLEAFYRPIVLVATERRFRKVLVVFLVLFPALIGLNVYVRSTVPLEAPSFARTVHPAPPNEITVHDRKVDLITAVNPYRRLEQSDPAEFRTHVENGRKVYYRNCFFCHGDDLAGDGMFAHGLNPIPTNFTDRGTIAMLQESYLFWRISKGGPGLPEEGGPWASAMPSWEKFLTEQEIWEVILFLYDHTGQRPRAREESKP